MTVREVETMNRVEAIILASVYRKRQIAEMLAGNIVVKIEVTCFHENLQFSVKNVANAIMF